MINSRVVSIIHLNIIPRSQNNIYCDQQKLTVIVQPIVQANSSLWLTIVHCD